MENNHFLSAKLFKAVKSLWILFLICFITDFVTRFFDPDHKNTLSRILDYMSYALNTLFFLWYFIVNKRWRSVAVILPFLFLFCFFMKDIRDMVDYYMPFEEHINSVTLRKWTYMILQLIAVFIIAKRYQAEEKYTGKNIMIKLFALNLGLFSLYYSDLGFIENLMGSASYDSKSTEFMVTFIYYFLSSIKSTAYLGAFLFLTGCIVKGENIYTFSKNALEYAGRYFWPASFMMITCVIFVFFSLLESAFKLELDFFGKNLNMFGWISTVVLVIFFIISSRFTGQFLRERSILKKKYYGAVGASVWIPLINIISLLMIRFDDKIKFLAPANTEKAKKIHLAVISLLLLFQFRKGIMAGKTDDILSCIVYITAFIAVAYIKKFTWIFPLVLGMMVTAIKVYPFYSGIYAQEFIFKDYVMDFLKNTASVALILTVIVFYGIYYIAYQTLNNKDLKA